MKKYLYLISIIVLAMVITGCVMPNNENDLSDFNYETTKKVKVDIRAQIPKVLIEIYQIENHPETGEKYAKINFSGVTNEDGNLVTYLTLPTYVDQLYVKRGFIGGLSEVLVAIEDSILYLDYSNPVVVEEDDEIIFLDSSYTMSYKKLGNWDTNGVPDYLMEGDSISSDLLTTINNSLPEKEPVPDYNPHYIAESAKTNLDIIENANVFVTFVHEGAGYKNSLGFYTYNTADGAPDVVNDEDITLIFPNVSYKGSGGGLKSGDKVNIGEFQPGTSIGWVIITNGYDTRRDIVGGGFNKFFSDSKLNPESNSSDKHHTVLLNYEDEDKLILSFEDLLRPAGDNDFNDAVFYVTSNPITAIAKTEVVKTTDEPPLDTDEDGIPDIIDAEPFDDNIVSSISTPGKGQFASLAFEDLWPYRGDYDFNDLIIDYNFEEFLNKDNDIVKIKGTFKVKAIVASMKNGFGFQFNNISPDSVESVTGSENRYQATGDDKIYLESNGVESRQTKAVIIVFDIANNHYDPEGETEVFVTINFNRAVTRNEIGYAPYNPFIIANGERGREIHLPGYQPTDLIWTPYFGSEDDGSVLGTNHMYKTPDDFPWGLNLPETFDYPADDVEISLAYNNYNEWVNSKGQRKQDWYLDLPGNKNYNYLH